MTPGGMCGLTHVRASVPAAIKAGAQGPPAPKATEKPSFSFPLVPSTDQKPAPFKLSQDEEDDLLLGDAKASAAASSSSKHIANEDPDLL